MNTHHILVNNAIIAGKHLELDTEVLYVYIIYVSKKPVGAINWKGHKFKLGLLLIIHMLTVFTLQKNTLM